MRAWHDGPSKHFRGIAGYGGFCFNDGNQEDLARATGRLSGGKAAEAAEAPIFVGCARAL
jgi:hypothetical protein